VSDRVVIDGDVSLTSTIDGEGNAFIRLGQNPIIEPLEVTENGTYEVPDGVEGFNPVRVALPEYDGAYTVEPSTEEQTLATAGKVMTQDVVINKAESGIGLYSSKKVEADASYGTFDDFKLAMLPDLPTDRDFVVIDFENNTSNNRAGIFWAQVRARHKKSEVDFAGRRVGGQFGGAYGCNVYAGATINVYVGDY
jgi:hypothetical protein